MDLYYIPNFNNEDKTAVFSEEESAHISRVMRQKTGNKVRFTNGQGWSFLAEITVSHPKHTEVLILEKEFFPKNEKFSLHLLVAPTKNISRFEWFLEKACEIGVDTITPLLTERTEHKKLNFDRLQRVLIAAMKQSQTMWLPQLNPLTKIQTIINTSNTKHRFVGWCDDITKGELMDLCPKNENIEILIGPEGDFSNEEIQILTESNYIPISMGTKRLRTETAALVACLTVNLKNR